MELDITPGTKFKDKVFENIQHFEDEVNHQYKKCHSIFRVKIHAFQDDGGKRESPRNYKVTFDYYAKPKESDSEE